MRIPNIKDEDLSQYDFSLVSMVARTSWLPSPETVAAIPGAVFPTCRYKSNHKRFSLIEEERVPVGMYDDNATPEWALFWSHNLSGTRSKGWTIAHVWPASDDIESYTRLANLAMVPEAFASLTDKDGPLTKYLRWHACQVYGWKPKNENPQSKPIGYDDIRWRYFEPELDPKGAIRRRFSERKNQRTEILQQIMERRGML